MHREISHTDPAFHQESHLSLYLMTGLLGVLLLLDLCLPDIGGYRIALVAAVLGGARVLYGSIESLLEGRLGADLALAVACVAAILIGEPLVAAEIVFIGMLGECLEAYTFARTQRAVRGMVELFPRRCWVVREGQEVRVLTSELHVGDMVVVKPGAKVPVDGIVREGHSAVDQSALTGESLPADKGPGDTVLAGSLNLAGALTIETERVAEHTVAGRVIELTARALKDKAPLERTADRWARYFLPAVLGLATLTFLVALGGRWLALRPEGGRLGLADVSRCVYPALSVLLVACPCPLILATPAAIIAALGRLAGTGVLLKGGSALERLAGITAIAFDKTGTLTEGRLELGEVLPLNAATVADLLRTAASAEQRSEHPIARLLVHEAAARGLSLDRIEEFRAHPGAGITARLAQGTVIVGTHRLLDEQGIALPPEVAGAVQRLDAAGQTPLLVARDGEVLGVIGARDRVRPEAAGVLADLRDFGIRDVALLTGDRAAVARTVAADVGITEVHAELLPEEKAAFLERWQLGRKVAMVGDGINDAPALARAEVGLAIGGTGADLAAEAGDVVLMGDPLRPLPLLFRLSRETVRIIRQNILVFAFGVNAVGVVLTAWLWPLIAPTDAWYERSPLAAVIYHQLGSLAVLLNAMRLLWFERTRTGPTWTRAGQALRDLDGWLERHFDMHEFGHWLEHHWRAVAAGLLGLLLLLYAASGFIRVEPDEVAVVRRFGLPVEDLGPGLHWRWPWPVHAATHVQPARVHTVEVGFRSLAQISGAPSPLTWASPHGGDGILRVPEEAVMITGDGNLIELQATVRYVIADARNYLFQVADADAVVRAMTESVLREAVAAHAFPTLLTTQREQFQREALDRIERRITSNGTLGIRLEGLSLHDLHPPQEVVEAYHDVARAMEARDRQVNEAEAEALRKKRDADAEALQVVRQARATAHETVRQAEAAQAVFLTRHAQRNELGLGQELALLRDAAIELWRGHTPTSVYGEYERRRRDQCAAQAALTDFRLYWDAIAGALVGRDKIIIDADRVPGRRHLLLLDPDQFRMPMLLPPERVAPAGRGFRGERREPEIPNP
jgi:Cu+-exporting ATPase